MNNMELTLAELNEMYYCLSVAAAHRSEHPLIEVRSLAQLMDKVRDEIDLKIYENENN
jgi:hypothetical protein